MFYLLILVVLSRTARMEVGLARLPHSKSVEIGNSRFR
jgi:hypothetical protein